MSGPSCWFTIGLGCVQRRGWPPGGSCASARVGNAGRYDLPIQEGSSALRWREADGPLERGAVAPGVTAPSSRSAIGTGAGSYQFHAPSCGVDRYGQDMGERDSAIAVIRPASINDAASIARVHATSWRETYGRFVDDPDTNPWFDVDRRVSMWSSNLEDQTFSTVVAAAEAGMIGFAAVQTTADGPESVRPEELEHALRAQARTWEWNSSGAPRRCARPTSGVAVGRGRTRALTRSTDETASSPTAPLPASARSERRRDSSAEGSATGQQTAGSGQLQQGSRGPQSAMTPRPRPCARCRPGNDRHRLETPVHLRLPQVIGESKARPNGVR